MTLQKTPSDHSSAALSTTHALPPRPSTFLHTLAVPLAVFFLASGIMSSCSKPAVSDSYVGKYKGRGASEEVRFRHPKGLLILTVKHSTEFNFKINEKGEVSGDGQITYDLIRNTEGLDSLVASVRGAMGVVGPGVAAAENVSKAADAVGRAADAGGRSGGLQYDAPHLKNGPEVRYFKIKGRVEKFQLHDGGGEEKRLFLEVVGDYTQPDGKVEPNLIAEYEVNNVKEEKTFPCWTPFLPGFGVLKKGEGGVWTADFSAKGKNREGKKVWQDYGYYWLAQQRD